MTGTKSGAPVPPSSIVVAPPRMLPEPSPESPVAEPLIVATRPAAIIIGTRLFAIFATGITSGMMRAAADRAPHCEHDWDEERAGGEPTLRPRPTAQCLVLMCVSPIAGTAGSKVVPSGSVRKYPSGSPVLIPAG